jgi:TonB-linked SusC/RagA family outer membrane protein
MNLFYDVKRKKWLKIMRISCTQLLLSLLFASMAYARDSNAQVNLNQKIDLNIHNEHIAKILKRIEKITNTKFVYSLNVVDVSKKATIAADNETLGHVLDEVLLKNGIGYDVINNRIVLMPLKGEITYVEKIPVIPIHGFPSEVEVMVHGKVTDDKGNPLVGVTVQVKNTNIGTVTNVKGEYIIHPMAGNDTLVFSFIGFDSREIDVNGRSIINVSLQISSSKLNELVVVGYGSQKRSDMTGSISSINGANVTHLPTQRVDQALQGQAAGVVVQNTDGAPGGNTQIRIRGINSINGGNGALIVIDGLQGGDLSSLNPNDIASIEVLKDASATAIYGSQGANGVILVTTKKGRFGKPEITYSYNIGISDLARKLPMLSAAQYAENVNLVTLSRNGNGLHPQPIFTESQIQAFQKNGGTDWQNVIYRTALTQNHQLSINGGSAGLNYRISGGYLNQQGILLNSAFKRFSVMAGLNANFTSWARAGFVWNGTRSDANSALFGSSTDWPNNPVGDALQFAPTIPIYDSNGNFSVASSRYGNPTVWNPLASAIEPLFNQTIITNNLNAFLEFTLAKGLTLRIMGGAILTSSKLSQFLNAKTFIGLQNGGLATVSNDGNEYYQNSNILTFDRRFGDHHLVFTGLEEQKFTTDYLSLINASQFLNQMTSVYDLGGANIKNLSSALTKRAIESYMGRLNYSFKDKYIATATLRADGSSVFGANNKWGFFPSGALAWNAFRESFIRDLNLFSNLKVRGSWGITGNQAINPYETLSQVISGNNYPYDGTNVANIGYRISSAANPNLKWESTRQIDIGLDAGFFNDRLTFTADYYTEVTKDLLMPVDLPTYTGLSSMIANAGSLANKGLEFTIAGDLVNHKNFIWHGQFNISGNRARVLSLAKGVKMLGFKTGGSGHGVNKAFMYLVPGQPYGQMYGWKYLGIWKTNQVKDAASYGQLPGQPHYWDKNNDGQIDIKDTTVIGNSQPKFIFGWTNQLTYKNFSLYVLFQGVYGNDIFNLTKVRLDGAEGTGAALLHRWTPQNQNSNIPGIIDESTIEAAGLVNKIAFPPSSSNQNSFFVESGSYLRLKNITLSYRFPSQLFNDKLKNLSLSISATNLLTITKYSGYDPEVSSYTANDAELGSDFYNYPPARTFTFGLNVSF